MEPKLTGDWRLTFDWSLNDLHKTGISVATLETRNGTRLGGHIYGTSIDTKRKN